VAAPPVAAAVLPNADGAIGSHVDARDGDAAPALIHATADAASANASAPCRRRAIAVEDLEQVGARLDELARPANRQHATDKDLRPRGGHTAACRGANAQVVRVRSEVRHNDRGRARGHVRNQGGRDTARSPSLHPHTGGDGCHQVILQFPARKTRLGPQRNRQEPRLGRRDVPDRKVLSDEHAAVSGRYGSVGRHVAAGGPNGSPATGTNGEMSTRSARRSAATSDRPSGRTRSTCGRLAVQSVMSIAPEGSPARLVANR